MPRVDGKGGKSTQGKYRNKAVLASLIREAQDEDFTVTFIGTKGDVDRAIRDYGILEANTLVHNNTSRGVSSSFTTTNVARTRYFKRLKKGEAVTDNFYQKTT